MQLPTHIAERIRSWVVETSKEGMHADHEAARYGGVSLMATIGATWLLRPDGSLWEVDDDFGKPLQPLAGELHTTALVAGAARHLWLAELVPERPVAALDCRDCSARGKIFSQGDPSQFFYCPACGGLGWTKTILRDCKRIEGTPLPQFDVARFEPLWIEDYYDGPISGAVLHDGQFCWYTLAEEREQDADSTWDRRYWLILLTSPQEDQERRWHDLFRTHVGTHWDYPYGLEPGRVRPKETHHLFYEIHSKREPRAFDDNEVLGWFQL